MCTSNVRSKSKQKSTLAGLCTVHLCTCVCMSKYWCANTGKEMIKITKNWEAMLQPFTLAKPGSENNWGIIKNNIYHSVFSFPLSFVDLFLP